jgi:NAD(P)-dependent dehydrogenase (short-subunit alcohol dehydrogenase family)
MDLQLQGKKAIVTGGSRGMGKAIARQLACEGCDVAIGARTEDVARGCHADCSGNRTQDRPLSWTLNAESIRSIRPPVSRGFRRNPYLG